jgi:hypothetical protein
VKQAWGQRRRKRGFQLDEQPTLWDSEFRFGFLNPYRGPVIGVTRAVSISACAAKSLLPAECGIHHKSSDLVDSGKPIISVAHRKTPAESGA